jgi:hypothetical protein
MIMTTMKIIHMISSSKTNSAVTGTNMNTGTNVCVNMNTGTGNKPPIHSLLFTTKKDKNKSKTIICNHANNPVDDRIEDLIRHSQIQAINMI